jgi:ATP-dependent DNA helicase RecQ
LETRVSLSRTRLEMMLKVLDVDGAVRRVRGGWISTGQPWSYEAERYTRVAETREAERRAMIAYEETSRCRLEFLRRALDDPGAEPCGRCDNCGRLEIAGAPDQSAVEAVSARLNRPGVTIEPRRMWPTAMRTIGIELSGRISVDDQAQPGRAIGRLTDLGWGNRLRELFRPETPDGELPVPLRHAIVAVLDAWEFDQVPTAIVAFRSRTRPLLLDHLADGLARYTSWPVVARIAYPADVGPPSTRAPNSARRLAQVCALEVDEAAVVAGQRILLVDDLVESGWSMTMASRLLRQAGADPVHPLALATVS